MIYRVMNFFILCLLFFVISNNADSHVNGSVYDAITGIKKRMLETLSTEEIMNLSESKLKEMMTEEELEILSTAQLQFTVNVPVIVYVILESGYGENVFWLKNKAFQKTEYQILVDDEILEVWRKEFESGTIGLGVASLDGNTNQYFVGVQARNNNVDLNIQDIYPGQARLAQMNIGTRVMVDNSDSLQSIPPKLEGIALIQTVEDWEDECTIIGAYQLTRFPSSQNPDQIILTWSDNPQTTQTIQWRTHSDVTKGVVSYMKKSDFNRFSPGEPKTVNAQTKVMETPDILNDPVCNRHTATIVDLDPGTTYVYSVGDGSDDGWSEMTEFTTAPNRTVPFSFIYMGDAQNGLDRWGTLVHNAFRERPDAAFYIMAGDLVNVGNERWDWDDLFYNASGIFDRRTVVPAIGNHENQGGHPTMYLEMFHLIHNGPIEVEPERAYSFEYSNALFVILDSNLEPEKQTAWLEKQLAGSDATWKFVVYHHPAYSSKANRDNPELRAAWTPIFDKYHVDMALQGHDHAYLRTYPMKNNQPVNSPEEGTIYVVSVSGVKMYEQDEHDYTAFGMTNVSTYQVLDIQLIGDRLVYKSYDIDGILRDTIVIEK